MLVHVVLKYLLANISGIVGIAERNRLKLSTPRFKQSEFYLFICL